MATSAQIKFFENLTDDRDFTGKDIQELRREFEKLSDRNASAWIEKALSLPKRDDSAEPAVEPPF